MRGKAEPVEVRFWQFVDKTDGCWLWTGGKTIAGYGQIGQGGGKHIFAHRLSYEMHHGPIPKGLWVLHHCDNPSCVRPEHLFLGTRSDNAKDAHNKGRGGFQTHPDIVPRGERHYKAKLTEAKVRHIRLQVAWGFDDKTIATYHGVSPVTIWSVRTGRNWKHVE